MTPRDAKSRFAQEKSTSSDNRESSRKSLGCDSNWIELEQLEGATTRGTRTHRRGLKRNSRLIKAIVRLRRHPLYSLPRKGNIFFFYPSWRYFKLLFSYKNIVQTLIYIIYSISEVNGDCQILSSSRRSTHLSFLIKEQINWYFNKEEIVSNSVIQERISNSLEKYSSCCHAIGQLLVSILRTEHFVSPVSLVNSLLKSDFNKARNGGGTIIPRRRIELDDQPLA